MTDEGRKIYCGDEEAFHAVFDEYYHRLCFYASRFVADGERVRDIVQDAFLSCWHKALTFPNHYALRSYLYSSVYHSCMDIVRSDSIRRRHHDIIRERGGEEDSDYLASRIEAEALAEIFRAIDELPTQCGRVFRMSYIDGRSVEEVAVGLGISPNTVKTQRARAKKLLQERLKNVYLILAVLFLS